MAAADFTVAESIRPPAASTATNDVAYETFCLKAADSAADSSTNKTIRPPAADAIRPPASAAATKAPAAETIRPFAADAAADSAPAEKKQCFH